MPSHLTAQSGIRGRWELETRDTDEGRKTFAWGEFVEESVQVVPCDGKAVESVAWALASLAGVGFIFSPHHAPDGVSAESSRNHFRDQARRVLRAAGRSRD